MIRQALHDALDAQLADWTQFDCGPLPGLLAQRLLAKAPGLDRVFFCNSGTEAVESALKFARYATGRRRVVYCDHAFHGLTTGSLSINGSAEFRRGFDPLLPDTSIPLGDLDALQAELRKGGVAALIIEPIQGKGVHTQRLGATESVRLYNELLADPKERTEHVMLVDLGRNDVGRVARQGSVTVDSLMHVERYSHVMHIVSNVTGRLDASKTSYDVLRACFPAGTVSGAPKIRAMEIIDELEPTRRGPYAGAVGYFSFSGNMDMCINIRTVVIKKHQAFIQAGAGIVADSNPEHEYEETCNKARAMMKAIELAEQGLE